MRVVRLLVLAAVLAGFSVTAATAPAAVQIPVSFSSAVAYPFGAGVDVPAVAVADLNGDGHPDVVAAAPLSSSGFGALVTLIANGDGTFGQPTYYGGLGLPAAVAVADINGDGHADLVAADSQRGDVAVFFGHGDGTFDAPPLLTAVAGANPSSVAVEDLNADGHPDLVVASEIGQVDVKLGDGTGSFNAAGSYPIGASADWVSVGDLNADGHADLAVADEKDGTVSVLLGDGRGGFGAATSYPAGAGAGSIAIGDLNGDGAPDVVVANRDDGTVSVFLGNGGGALGPPTTYATGAQPTSVAIGDVNGDGYADVAVANSGDGTLSVLLGDGSGGLYPQTTYPAGSGASFVALADLNGDGQLDAVVGDLNPGGISVLLNTGSAGAATVSARVLSSISVSIDKTSLDFGSLLPRAMASRPVTATVTSNDPNGYQLAASRAAFTPRDLPLSIGCAACGLVVTPVPTAGLLQLVQAASTSAAAGDAWETSVELGPVPATAPAGSYSSTLTFTAIGL